MSLTVWKVHFFFVSPESIFSFPDNNWNDVDGISTILICKTPSLKTNVFCMIVEWLKTRVGWINFKWNSLSIR